MAKALFRGSIGMGSSYVPYIKLILGQDVRVDFSMENIPSHKTLSGYDLVVFGGGPDVSPNLYGANKSKKTNSDDGRDNGDVKTLYRVIQHGTPILGICRGAQLLNVVAGGSLIQDVSNHTSDHFVRNKEGHSFSVVSTHHQMVDPDSIDYGEITAWSDGKSDHYTYDDKNTKYSPIRKEPEAIYIPRFNAIAVQWHPERMNPSAEGSYYPIELLHRYT